MKNINTELAATFNELIEGMDNVEWYDYMRIILSHRNGKSKLGAVYLMITMRGFGLVRLLAVDYLKDHIQIDIECVSTQARKKINFDVEDETFRFILVSWSEIKELESKSSGFQVDD